MHGIDIDGSGTYDGEKPSSLDPNLPFEATVPAVCGTLAASPSGPIQTGFGGAATDPTGTHAAAMWLFGAVGLGLLAIPFAARRRATAAHATADAMTADRNAQIRGDARP